MIPSTSTDPPLNDSIQMLSELTDYEDALSSEEEFHRLCTTLKNQIRQKTKARKERKNETKIIRPKAVSYDSVSSSEHSSIEKLQPGEMRSRRGTGLSRRHSDSDNGEWKMLNFAFQEMTHYPILIQLNEHLSEIAKQLNEIEATNVMQLKIIMHLLTRMSKPRQSWFQIILRTLKNFQFFIFAFTWPFMARVIYYWYLRLFRPTIT
ncbi:unnamed protein product [Caenorhabditis bovis]|uniref:Uncharacterized protein n=1 Tax=Caenorhabditis bovis TaxID=2654633 RepID=A0A8S1EH68_9PELO|nr:unnamed protein product [Caenorhabditis bovis]